MPPVGCSRSTARTCNASLFSCCSFVCARAPVVSLFIWLYSYLYWVLSLSTSQVRNLLVTDRTGHLPMQAARKTNLQSSQHDTPTTSIIIVCLFLLAVDSEVLFIVRRCRTTTNLHYCDRTADVATIRTCLQIHTATINSQTQAKHKRKCTNSKAKTLTANQSTLFARLFWHVHYDIVSHAYRCVCAGIAPTFMRH